LTSVAVADIEVFDDVEQPCRMRKKAVQQGRSEQSGESYSVPYVEPLSEARTPLADFFRILLDRINQIPATRSMRRFVTSVAGIGLLL
jgi:hypothetical protein